MKIEHTQRGFARVEFNDRNGEPCSLQESSLADEAAIWFGVNEPSPKIMQPGKGWVDWPLPEGVSCTTRMHLTRLQVRALLPMLQHFAETGELA